MKGQSMREHEIQKALGKLPPSGQRMYVEILAYMRETSGVPPTMRELMKRLDYHSTSVVHHHFKHMKALGLIEQVSAQRWKVTGAVWLPPAGVWK